MTIDIFKSFTYIKCFCTFSIGFKYEFYVNE